MPPDPRKAFVKAHVDDLSARGLCANPLGLYLHLLKHAQGKEHCWPGDEVLTKALGISRATLRRYAAELEEAGLIQRPPQGAKVNEKHPYVILQLRADLSEVEAETSRRFERSRGGNDGELRADPEPSSLNSERALRADLSEAIHEVEEEKEIKEVDDDGACGARAKRASPPPPEKKARKIQAPETAIPQAGNRQALDVAGALRIYLQGEPRKGAEKRIWHELGMHRKYGTQIRQAQLRAAAMEARKYVDREQGGQAKNLGPFLIALREVLVPPPAVAPQLHAELQKADRQDEALERQLVQTGSDLVKLGWSREAIGDYLDRIRERREAETMQPAASLYTDVLRTD